VLLSLTVRLNQDSVSQMKADPNSELSLGVEALKPRFLGSSGRINTGMEIAQLLICRSNRNLTEFF
jgi:hypothetical protein